jgi:hypothetical protein
LIPEPPEGILKYLREAIPRHHSIFSSGSGSVWQPGRIKRPINYLQQGRQWKSNRLQFFVEADLRLASIQ